VAIKDFLSLAHLRLSADARPRILEGVILGRFFRIIATIGAD
jgi:hypothetical protein